MSRFAARQRIPIHSDAPARSRNAHRHWRPSTLFLVLSFLALGFASPSRAQFSPGPLSRAHEKLDGVRSCTKCHELGMGKKGPSDDRCLACHGDLRERIRRGSGFHARGGRDVGCARCHSEHNGRGFDLPGLDPATFDHSETGHPLSGAHRALACDRCHQRARTYTGLDPACSRCHEDPHEKALGADCSSCHDENGFRPAPGFDHAEARFPLTGAHVSVACEGCHKDPRYRGVRFDDCARCHDSPHTADFLDKRPCGSCHDPGVWTAVAGARFDHATTPFPLEGAHARADCAACHTGRRYAALASARCADCHEGPHGGQFQSSRPSGCGACHGTEGWRPAVRFDHAASGAALDGAHARTPCVGCHAGGGYTGTPRSCVSCHDDVHGGAAGDRCERCHVPEEWEQVEFAHGATGFPLTGKHLVVACSGCHGPAADARFAGTDPACAACHADPHASQFIMAHPESGGGARSQRTACASCHATKDWDAVRFDHRRTGFPLEVAHASLACTECHVDGEYAGTPAECAMCHGDPHDEQFVGQSCPDCHAPTSWSRVRFDHRGTSFALTGRHRDLACAACHRDGWFRGLSPRCADCHEDAHFAALGPACDRCHTAEQWVPATFAHGVDVFPRWGGHQAVDCAACHRDEVTWQIDIPPRECLDCHEEDLRRAPAGSHGMADEDCERCHGLEDWRGARAEESDGD